MDGTASQIKVTNMVHAYGLAVVNLKVKSVPQTYYYDGNTGNASSVRKASIETAKVWPSVSFSSTVTPYNASNTTSVKKYVAIVKPSSATTISTTATSGCEAWSLSYNVSKNTSSSQSVTSSRPGYYLGWVYTYKGAVETFTAPETGTYKLEVWGAEGGYNTPYTSHGGLGGYSYGNYLCDINKAIYVCVGHMGAGGSSAYNNRRTNQPLFDCGFSGGGATSLTTNLKDRGTGELINYKDHKDEVIIVAGGGGSLDTGTSAGYGGGEQGGDGNDISGTGATIEKPGTTYGVGTMVEADFGIGGYGNNNGDYGGQGGGGYYGGGGGASGFAGGGGSGYVNTSLLVSGSAKTIAGNQEYPSPSGQKETGHSGNGYAIITEMSY